MKKYILKNIQTSHEYNKGIYDKHRPRNIFAVHDIVKIQIENPTERNRKLKPRYLAPAIVTVKHSDLLYDVKLHAPRNRQEFKNVHIARLRPYHLNLNEALKVDDTLPHEQEVTPCPPNRPITRSMSKQSADSMQKSEVPSD